MSRPDADRALAHYIKLVREAEAHRRRVERIAQFWENAMVAGFIVVVALCALGAFGA